MNLPKFYTQKGKLRVNPIGEYCALDHNGRRLIGEIIATGQDEDFNVTWADVKHFNGEPWPFRVLLHSLYWIKQSSDACMMHIAEEDAKERA